MLIREGVDDCVLLFINLQQRRCYPMLKCIQYSTGSHHIKGISRHSKRSALAAYGYISLGCRPQCPPGHAA